MIFRLLKYYIFIIAISLFAVADSFCEDNDAFISTFIITNINKITNDSVPIVLKWNDFAVKNIDVRKCRIVVNDLNNSGRIYPVIYISKEKFPEGILFKIKLDKNEPLHPYEIVISENDVSGNDIKTDLLNAGKQYSITYLNKATKCSGITSKAFKWSDIIAESVIAIYPDPVDLDIYRSHDWNYTNGFMINAFFELYKKSGNKKYLEYVKKWYLYFINSTGKIDSTKYKPADFELDAILPGRTLLYLYKETGEEKYKTASDELIDQLAHQPRTKDGCFWHKKVYKNQMWLDGIYMADVFLLQYAQQFSNQKLMAEGTDQLLCAYRHMHDPNTGLLFHGWDESKNIIWANQQTGTSPEFWARGMGWYIMALADGIQYVPGSNSMRDSLIFIFRSVSRAVANCQDQKTGLWFQVMDKGNRNDNWIETSASAMFAYAIIKGYKSGILDSSFKDRSLNAFNGLKKNYLYFDNSGKIYLTGTVKVGTLNFKSSNGSYEYYTSVDRRVNDFKGLAALLYLSMELDYK